MSQTIHKALLKISNRQELAVPKGAEFLCAREQRGEVCIWYRCNPNADMQIRTIVIHGTGHEITPSGDYVGTVLLYNGDLVLHVFVQ